MAGQLGPVPLDVAEGDALAVPLEGLEQVGRDQLGTLDDAHSLRR